MANWASIKSHPPDEGEMRDMFICRTDRAYVCRPRGRAVLNAAVTVLLGMFSGSVINAQGTPPTLFTSIPNNQLADTTPDQSARLEQIRSRPTTQSLTLIRINP